MILMFRIVAWLACLAISPIGTSSFVQQNVVASNIMSHSLTFAMRLFSVSSGSTSNDENNASWIDKANAALDERDLATAEESLMMAVAEVNGAVMNHPKLLRGFEDLFRTKIKISQDNQDNDEAWTSYQIAQDRMGLASLLTDQSKYQEAADELELAVRSLSLLLASDASSPAATTLDRASSLLFRTRAMICDWSDYDRLGESLAESTQRALQTNRVPAVHPFEALTWPCVSLKDATAVAHAYGMRAFATAAKASGCQTQQQQQVLPWSDLGERLPRTSVPFVRAITTSSTTAVDNRVIKVGYLSPDFTGKHPLAFLMQDVFRFHDASRFEVKLYSLGGAADQSSEVQKILNGASSWTTLTGSIPEMAETIRNDDLDVLVDLCGYTGTSLVAEVLACLRLTTTQQGGSNIPIHVGYMGYPGSSGAPFIEYMIADATVIPSQCRQWYTENILFMPHCYFVNSHRHIRSSNCERAVVAQQREDYGLPPSPAFVYCCHSRPDKIDPQTFGTWIKALERTRKTGIELGRSDMANAVLWLLKSSDGSQMEANLREYARGIWEDANDAIVFCNHAPRQEHLARLSLADLFLDTPAYNAHTVGCDCLSAGVPMLSLVREHHDNTDGGVPTEKLASRVGSSLLKSSCASPPICPDKLVVSTMGEYEDRMVECAMDTTHWFSSHLLEERPTAPLWDTERWVRNLETGLSEMVDRRQKKNEEADIYVMDYSGL